MRARLLLLCISLLGRAAGQDPFEIHVYEYEPLTLHEYSLEAHVNFMAQGLARREGTLLPTQDQLHLTLEPTFGLCPSFALGFMFLGAWQPGNAPQLGGWRILPHFYVPESWHLPFRVGFVSEFSFQNTRYEENSRRVELRPILDKEFTHVEVAINPVFERAVHGPGTRHGWNFEPAVLLRWKRKVFSPSLEYYGGIESINVVPRAQPEVHQLFAGGDWKTSERFSVNYGTGFDLSARGPGLIVKSRLEWDWRLAVSP